MNAPLAFIDEIETSIAHSSDSRRAEMVRHLTDLFLVNADQYSAAEVALIDDVFVRLVVTIEESARALLAIRLGPISNAPPKIVRTLACDDAIDVASPVLIRSEQLDDSILIGCARTKSQEHLLAISRRKTLTEPVTDILVERGDQQVVLSTVQNSGARFSEKGFRTLVRRSDGDDLLAKCVGTRPDIPRHIFDQLLEIASDTVRAKLEAENRFNHNDVQHAVGDVTDRIRAHAAAHPPNYAAAQALVESLKKAGQLVGEKVDAFARAGEVEQTIAALALMTDMPIEAVQRKFNEEQAEFVLVLAKSIGLSWQTAKAILGLSAGKSRRSPREIDQCEQAFFRLNQPTAQQIISFHRTRERAAGKQLM
jgi:uncharacterized protein (DUF2336 family)